MTLHLSSEADVDYLESLLFYLTEESPQSADRFTNELEKSYDDICEAPYRNREVEVGLREKRVKGFPFSVLYTIEADEIFVHAIYHDYRKRSKLRERM
jgi:toxin ParE1/3/4